ncbi:sensor histidine kinase [Halobacillus campisalis]|uniref:histidine kinase n=1 Tax=Halobacillus campisalis TaxID=435909 RepID=A0ABW2K0A1_9BACI|nr:HAMP domain-containing sensor histidine kinase [Halobacillus campisalis]
MKKWFKSLQAKYLFIILTAVLAIPIALPIMSAFVYLPGILIEDTDEPYGSAGNYEDRWHEEAGKLSGAPPEKIGQRLEVLSKEFPEAGMFWVDEKGETRDVMNYEDNLPEVWTSSYTVDFMKDHYDTDPLTVVAFIGDSSQDEGFMVTKVDRVMVGPPIQRLNDWYSIIFYVGMGLAMLGFITMSWLFFRKFHKRLMKLKHAMEQQNDSGIPLPVQRSNDDEIGQLEVSFNRMIHQLEEGRMREQQEERIRRELIANLSHDLRTPLTTIRASLSGITDEVTSNEAQQKLASVNQKIDYLSHLIDNLLSFTLLSGKKYPYKPKTVEVNRLMKEIAAHWYPTLEQRQIEVDLETTREVYWDVDPKWMERMFDNLLQNLVRYAAEGKYARIAVNESEIMLEDRGPGMQGENAGHGAGIGLSIVDLMAKEMNLRLHIQSNDQGTIVKIAKKAA